MANKTPKQGPEFSREREWTAVLEELQSQFRAFGDGLENVSRKLEILEEDMASVKSDLAVIKVAMATKVDLKKIESDLKKFAESFDKRLTSLETR